MKLILSAGHRNEDRGGAAREIDWTYPACVAIRDEMVKHGHEVWIIQEQDGDRDPSFSHNRYLGNVAALCVDLARVVGGVDLYLSIHYEGTGTVPGPAGAFGVYPDWGKNDHAGVNPLDIQVARALGRAVAATGMGLRGDGTMTERHSYVGSQGYRLGEFAATVGFRERTARVIFEAGNYSNPGNRELLWRDSFRFDAYPKAVRGALESVFGKGTGAKPVDPVQPDPAYAPAMPVQAVVDSDRALTVLDNDALLVRVDDHVKAVRETPRLQYAYAGADRVGPDIPAGETFDVSYLIVNPDHSKYWLTPWWTRVRFEDCQPA